MMLDQFKTETSGLDWSYPQSQGLTIYDAVKLASIVERESSGDEQIRAQVASVFYNRLNNFGDPNYGFLQSDATTAYELGHDPRGYQESNTVQHLHEHGSASHAHLLAGSRLPASRVQPCADELLLLLLRA
jgi:cell division protein YceG involved in septum cleavage